MSTSTPNESRRTFALTAVNLAAALVAAFALLTGGQRAATLGLTRHGQTLTAQDAGAADAVAVVAIAPGTAGQVYTISDAGLPHWAAAQSSSAITTTYYASDGTAANGAGGDATSSVSGAGSESTVTLSVSSTARQITGSVIACGTWVSPTISRSARRVTLYVRSTAASGFTTGGFRYLQMSMRRSAESPPASMLLGASSNDANAYYCGNFRTNSASSASYNLGALSNTSPLMGTDRWLRVVWELDDNGPRMRFAAGATTGSTRPALWTPLNVDVQTQAASRTDLGSLGTADAQLILGLESYGGGGSAGTLTLSLTMEVES